MKLLMIPEEMDRRSARKQIADPTYKSKRISMLNQKLCDCYHLAESSSTKRERDFYLGMSSVYRKRIEWYLR